MNHDACDEITMLLREGNGLVCRRDHPRLAAALDWHLRRGRLRAVLPGVYTDAADSLELRLRAVAAWDPDAVLTHQAAARVTFWPRLAVPCVQVATRTRMASRTGFDFRRRHIPAEFHGEVQGLRCTTPALTALDLCATTVGGNAIDTVLRTRAATLEQLHETLELTAGRRGNTDRRRLLLDSRDEPWSEAERDLHRLLRAARIEGWRGNHPVAMLTGHYFIDVAFPALKLAIEVDGRSFHEGAAAFEADRWRQNDLVLAGWRVLRFTAIMVRDQPQIVLRLIERALAG